MALEDHDAVFIYRNPSTLAFTGVHSRENGGRHGNAGCDRSQLSQTFRQVLQRIWPTSAVLGYAVYDCVCTTVVAVYFSACCIFSIGLSFPFVFSLDVVRLGHKPKFVFSPDVIPCG